MDKKYAGINSTVGYISVDDEEFCEVKIVNTVSRDSVNEISKDSPLGEALMLCEEGETRTVHSQEPYEIKIITIINPVEKPKPEPIIAKNKENEPVFIADFVPATTGNYASYKSEMKDGLIVGHAYDRKAKEVYFEGIKYFGWDYSKAGSFFPQKLLFDKNCTKEGYSLWFMPYSNLNNYRNKMANWIDFISSDFTVVKEIWKEVDNRVYDDKDIRVTFAKQKDGRYLYLGIFQASEYDEETRCKTYRRIETDYYC